MNPPRRLAGTLKADQATPKAANTLPLLSSGIKSASKDEYVGS
jgi:hypothetical protein